MCGVFFLKQKTAYVRSIRDWSSDVCSSDLLVAVLLERGLVPARAVLAAAADVGDHVHAAALQPALADRARVRRGQRDLEAAVAVQQGRRAAVERQVLRDRKSTRLNSSH